MLLKVQVMNMNPKTFNCFMLFLLFYNGVWCQEKKSNNTVQDAIPANHTAKEKGTTVKIKVSGLPEMTFKSTEQRKKRPKLICPESDPFRSFFSVRCKVNKECSQLGNKNMLCCNNRCLKGIPAPPPEPVHSPTLFGLVGRVCPSQMLPEIFEIKKCTDDSDCSPRICCPEKMLNGEVMGFCRTAEPKLDRLPAVQQFMEPLRLMMSYMQCTPPPPPFLDVFPKECSSPLDCFPNLCCQERGKRFCRPARRSLLTLFTTVAQRIIPSEVARDFINRVAS